jgi:hypothetical protein
MGQDQLRKVPSVPVASSTCISCRNTDLMIEKGGVESGSKVISKQAYVAYIMTVYWRTFTLR